MGGEQHQQSSTGPKTLSSLWRKRQSTHPLGEEIKNTVSVLEIKEPWIEIPFSCLENHWLTHEVFTGVVSTTRQWWSGTGISDCFFKAWRANPTDIASIMGQFFLLWSTFLITEHKIAKKSHWNYQTWPALNIRLSVIWSFSEGFSLI